MAYNDNMAIIGSPGLQFKKLREDAILPTRATDQAAGMDLVAVEPVVIPRGEWRLVPCGFAMRLNRGFEAQVRSRSGLAAKFGVSVLNSPGTIDSDYRGEVKVLLHNQGTGDFSVKPGDRIAQMVIAPIALSLGVEVSELDESDRGTNGFGSTGR